MHCNINYIACSKIKVYTADLQPSAVCVFLLRSTFSSAVRDAPFTQSLLTQNCPMSPLGRKVDLVPALTFNLFTARARGPNGILHTSYVSTNVTFDTAGVSIGCIPESG